MARLIVYYAHPGHKHSHVNCYMARAAEAVDGITFVDLYRDYPRFDINVDIEQQRLLDHDVSLFQFLLLMGMLVWPLIAMGVVSRTTPSEPRTRAAMG